MPRTHSRKHGFTLIEVMVSIAIVLLLVAGINTIFQTAGKAVGAGQTLSDAARNNQAAQSVMFRDFANCATVDAPYIIIYSRNVPALRNQADLQADRDYDPSKTLDIRHAEILTTDLDNNGTEGEAAVPGENISPVTYNSRNHRTDIIEFFGRDQYRRQTGNPGVYVANQASAEAMLWYGHLAIPNNTGSVTNSSGPGAGTFGSDNNPNNFFATQWILGREAIVLSSSTGTSPSVTLGDNNGNSQNFLTGNAGTTAQIAPLSYDTQAYMPNGNDSGGTVTINTSRYDVADTSINDFRSTLTAWINANNADFWWQRFMSTDTVATTLTPQPPQFGGQSVSLRFQANPFLDRPLTSRGFSQTTPIFLTGCTQFIVEFAGDFITQKTDGTTDAAQAPDKPDGQIDFMLDANGHKKIRWYGMPRNTNTLGGISIPCDYPSGSPKNDPRVDVVPVRDITNAHVPLDFEAQDASDTHDFMNMNPSQIKDYGAINVLPAANASEGASYSYCCHWGPKDKADVSSTQRPSYIRITYTLDDPSARLPDGITYEYVFKIQ